MKTVQSKKERQRYGLTHPEKFQYLGYISCQLGSRQVLSSTSFVRYQLNFWL